MKILRIVLYGLGGLVVLAVVAVAAAALIVDGAFVKARLEQAMKEKNRTLTIEGTPKVRLFPVAGIALGKTSLSEPGSDKVFVALDSAEVAVRTMPLLSGEIAVETLKLSGLRVNLVRGKDGTMNFSDLAGGKAKPASGSGAPPAVKLAEVLIEKAQLSYRDEATGQEISVAGLGVKTGRLDGQTPGDVSVQAHITGKKPEIDLRVQSSGALRFDLARSEFGFDKFSVQAKGRIDRDTLDAQFSAPKVEVTPARAAGSEVHGSVLVKGPQRNVDAKLRIAAVEGSARALDIPSLALELDAATEDLKIKASLQAAIKANLERQELNATIAGKLDDAALKASVALTHFAPLAASFDASFDRVNLDRYLPPDRKEKADERIDLDALKGKKVTGKLAVGSLIVKHLKLESLKAELKLADGRLEIAPWSANLYGGTTSGSLSVDANGNRFHVKDSAQNVAIGPLLRDAAQKDLLEGHGNVTLDVQTAGATVPALKKALAGSARLLVKDGAIKGYNLADTARNLKSALGAKPARPDPSQKTDFTELSASFAIKNGVAHNDDLKAQSPFLRLGGAGDIDIGNSTINYTAKATLVATSKGQGGREAGSVAGVTVPVRLSGALDNPDWHVDYSALAGSAGGVLGKAAGGVTDTAKKGAGGVTDAVRGLFKR